MSCKREFDILAFLDGSLPESRSSGVQAHLESCPDCAAFHEEQVAFNDLLTAVEPQPLTPPDEIWSRIEASIIESQSEERAGGTFLDRFVDFFRMPQLGYGFAAGLLLMITGIVAVHTQQSSQVVNQTLAELDRFSIEAPAGENPFLINGSDENPFFIFEEDGEGNPFRVGGVKK